MVQLQSICLVDPRYMDVLQKDFNTVARAVLGLFYEEPYLQPYHGPTILDIGGSSDDGGYQAGACH